MYWVFICFTQEATKLKSTHLKALLETLHKGFLPVMYFNMIIALWIIEAYRCLHGSGPTWSCSWCHQRIKHPSPKHQNLELSNLYITCDGLPSLCLFCVYKPRQDFCIFWVTNPIWGCLGLILCFVLTQVVWNYLLISNLIFFLASLFYFSVVPFLSFIWNSFSLPRVYSLDVEESHPSWGFGSARQTQLSQSSLLNTE